MKNKLWEDCGSSWQQAVHSAGTHQGLVSLWFPAEKYGLRRYGVGKKRPSGGGRGLYIE